jgi:hypothetical protein
MGSWAPSVSILTWKRARAWSASATAVDPDPTDHGLEGHRVVTMPGTGDAGDRPAARIRSQMDLTGQPAAGAAQRFAARLGGGFVVIRPSPPCPTR